jgi:hypothetical protein
MRWYVAPAMACIFVALSALRPFQQKDNTLTDAEVKSGWRLLWDGKSFKGWRGYNKQPYDSWEIVSGQLHCKGEGAQKRADLVTVAEYDNFELSVDWKIDKAHNSGICYRVVESDRPAYESGPEYQLIDDNGYPDKLEDWQKSGSDYAMHPPLKLTAKSPGEYNHTKLIVKGAHVEHWLNGEKVADFELWTPEWKALKEKSKWKDVPAYGMAKKGYIALQDHGGGVWFKNIRYRRL